MGAPQRRPDPVTQTQWEHHIMLLRMALESAEALRRSAQPDKKEPP